MRENKALSIWAAKYKQKGKCRDCKGLSPTGLTCYWFPEACPEELKTEGDTNV